MQEEKRGRVFRAGLAVKNREAVDLYGAIEWGDFPRDVPFPGPGGEIEMMLAAQKPRIFLARNKK